MPLFLPKALTVNRFVGGFKATSDYTDLGLTETADAQNCEYGAHGDIKQRKGSGRILNTRLQSSTGSSTRSITGHYFFRKLGDSTGMHVVGCGDSLFNFQETSATTILSGLTDNSNTFWDFVQIQDMRSASDDIVIGTNGEDNLVLFNGSASAIYLSAVTSATQVPIGKFLLSHKNRVYVANITSTTEADSPVKVFRTEIGSDAAPNPHRFTQNFFVGGSDSDGEIQGMESLRDDIIFYTRNSIWRFQPQLGDTNLLHKVKQSVGLLAPHSLVNTGQSHIFLSERGLFSFDGTNLLHLSDKVDQFLLGDTRAGQLQYSKAVFDYERNFYILYVPDQNSNRNNRGLVFDLKTLTFQPKVTGREVSFISNFQDSNLRKKVIYGDYQGYLYEDNKNKNDGVSTGFNYTVTSATVSSAFINSGALTTTNDGMKGHIVRIYEGAGVGQERIISENTSQTITLENIWTTTPDATSKITVGGIDTYWRSKDFDFEGEDIIKLFRQINMRLKEQGKHDLDLYYIIDFNRLQASTLKQLSQYKAGMAWGTAKWGEERWGGFKVINKKVSLRNTTGQSLNGTHLAIRFGNPRANQEFSVSGFDIIKKDLGRE